MTQSDLRKSILISSHMWPSLALQVPSFLCPFGKGHIQTSPHAVDHKCSCWCPTVQRQLLELLRMLWEPLTHFQDSPSVPPHLAHRSEGPRRTGTHGWWPTCCTAMLLNLPVLQEPPHCPELLQLQRIQLVHSLTSTCPVRVPKTRKCRRNELSGTVGKVILPSWDGKQTFPCPCWEETYGCSYLSIM